MHHHADTGIGWLITDHVCRICLGRVLRSTDHKQVRCADCGLVESGTPHAICCCGVRLATGKDAGLRCKLNETKAPDVPQQVCVEHIDVEPHQRVRTRKAHNFSATIGQEVLGDDSLFPK